MPIAVASTRQLLADTYKGATTHGALCKGDPGSGPSVANEVSGTGPEGAYARRPASGTSGTTGTVTYANLTFNAPATGSTWDATHVALCSGLTGNNMVDKGLIVDSNGTAAAVRVGPLGGVVVVTNLKFTQT